MMERSDESPFLPVFGSTGIKDEESLLVLRTGREYSTRE